MLSLDKLETLVYNEDTTEGIDWLKLYNAISIEEMYEISNGRRIMDMAIKYIENFINCNIIEMNEKTNLELEHELDIKTALKQGREDGIKLGKEIAATNMLRKNYDINEIASIVGISIKQIKSLQKELKSTIQDKSCYSLKI